MNIYSGQYNHLFLSLGHTVLAADQISAGRITDHTHTLKITSKTSLSRFVVHATQLPTQAHERIFAKIILRCFFHVLQQFQSKMPNEWH